MAEPPTPARHGPFHALRARLPTMLAEVVSVVFAVLVALAVDEAWEDRENLELGRAGMAAVATEMRGNLRELRGDEAETRTVLAALDSALSLPADRLETVDLSVNYPVALLSSAAWQTAQVTRAVHYVPLERVTRVARVYDLQTFFARNQEQLTDRIADIDGSADRDALLRQLRDVAGRYRLVAALRDALMGSYACTIAELDGHTPDSREECDALVDADSTR